MRWTISKVSTKHYTHSLGTHGLVTRIGFTLSGQGVCELEFPEQTIECAREASPVSESLGIWAKSHVDWLGGHLLRRAKLQSYGVA